MAITLKGYQRPCVRVSGGVKRIGLIQASKITAVTTTDGEITAITRAAGAAFKEYQSVLDQSEFKNSSSEASIQLRFAGNTPEASAAYNELIDQAPCGLVALIEMNNGKNLLLGYTEEFGFTRPLTSVELDATSGKAITDPNYMDVTLKTTQVIAPLYLSETLDIDTLYEATV